MRFATRATIAILAGIGSGLLGFGLVWKYVTVIAREDPGIGYNAWLLSGIFVPGVLVSLLVFRHLSLTPQSLGAKS
jgi:hypothetical protein